MANPTTNYGFVLPTSTDLVTDLPADFDIALQGVDTRLKALQPGTTLGDIAYSSATANTNTRLPIGTSGQVLAVSGGGVPAWTTTADVTPLTTKGDLFTYTTADARLGVGTDGQTLVADSSTATGLKWAAASSGAMTLINRTTYSSAATITVDSVFSATYSSYVVVMEGIGCVNATDSMRIKFRDSGGNLTAATYYGNALTTQHYNTTVTSTPSSGLTYLQLTTGGMGGQGAGTYGRAWYQFQGVGNTSENSVMFGNHYTTNNTQNNLFGGSYTTSAIVTGFQILSSGTNVAGTIAVYGLAEA